MLTYELKIIWKENWINAILIVSFVFLVEAPSWGLFDVELKELPATKHQNKPMVQLDYRCIKERKIVSFKIKNVTNVFNHLNG